MCQLILCPVLHLLSPGWCKTSSYSVISNYGYFFYMPRFIYLFRTSFILVFSQRIVMLTGLSYFTALANEKENLRTERKQNYLIKNEKRKKNRLLLLEQQKNDRSSLFFSSTLASLLSAQGCSLTCLMTTASGDFKTTDSLPVNNNWWSWIWLKRAKQTLMCSFLYFLMIQFAEFNLLEWRP